MAKLFGPANRRKDMALLRAKRKAALRPGTWSAGRGAAMLAVLMVGSSYDPPKSQGLTDFMQGALLMTAAAFCFAIMNVLVRLAAEELDPLQIAFLRNFFALAFMLPLVAKAGQAGFKTERLGLHIWRAVVGLGAMTIWFAAVTLVPLGEAVALNFTLPLFATAGAAIFLAEKVGPRRWAATALGFIGMLVILRPGFAEISVATALPIIAAVFMATSVLIVKVLARTESPTVIVLYMNLIMTPLSLIPALFVWRWPSWEVWLWVALLGLIASVAHLAMTRSYKKADASAVLPFDYARLPFVAVLGYFIFDETVDLWTWVGAAIIAAAVLYIAHRETLRGQQQATAPTSKSPQAP